MYIIIPVPDFEKAKAFAPHCDWCICQAKFDYDTYTLNGETFYFCLKEGFEKTAKRIIVEPCHGASLPLSMYNDFSSADYRISVAKVEHVNAWCETLNIMLRDSPLHVKCPDDLSNRIEKCTRNITDGSNTIIFNCNER